MAPGTAVGSDPVCGGGGTGAAGGGRRDAAPAAVGNDAAGCVRYQTDEGGGAFGGGGAGRMGARAGWPQMGRALGGRALALARWDVRLRSSQVNPDGALLMLGAQLLMRRAVAGPRLRRVARD